jgi:Rod binding domain-containing protein
MDIAAPLPAIKAPFVANTGDKKRAEAAAQEFEGMIIGQLLEPMFEGIKTDGAFGGGTGEMVFRSLMVQQMGKDIAASGGLGLAKDVMATMLRMQEAHAR